ncbi:hypothetical protein KKI24_28900 [bacterium]|nr:hypothetical protein [bacterium]
MALKKNFSSGSKYYYAVITYFGYVKDPTRQRFGLEHKLDIALFVKDSEDENSMIFENQFSYLIPEKRTKEGFQTVEIDGEEVQQSIGMVVDTEFQNPFDVDNMNPEGANILSLAYLWLTSNIELFRDFEDC